MKNKYNITRFYKIIFYTSLILLIGLISCEANSSRIKKLEKEIEWEINNQKIMNQNVVSLNAELEKIFSRSLLYRFPQTTIIQPGRLIIKNKEVPYLKAIEFNFITTQKIEVIVTYKSDEKVSPHYSIFLFSDDGLNIHRHDVNHTGIFSSSIKPGKEKDEKEKVVISGSRIPTFFLIQDIKG